MNTLHWQEPQFHCGPALPTHPICIVVDTPDMAGDVHRTPHVFGGMNPLLDVAARIAAGLDPRSFVDPSESWSADGIESRAMLDAIDKACGMAAVYAHKLIQRCALITQLEIEQAQEQARQQAEEQNPGTQKTGANGKGRLKL